MRRSVLARRYMSNSRGSFQEFIERVYEEAEDELGEPVADEV
jgi:hypothetical protein